MRILIIIKDHVPESAASGFLVFFAIFAFVFSQDGDRKLGAENTIQGDTKCFPDVDSYRRLVGGYRNLANGGSAYSAEVENRLLSSLGIVRVPEGEEVVIQGREVRYAQGFFTPVSLIERDSMSCLIDSRLVEMGLWQWIKWKTKSLFYK